MKSMSNPVMAAEIKARVALLQKESRRQWGTMDVAQALAHCSGAIEMALGERKPPRVFFGRLVGWLIKPLVLGDDKPMRQNTPTVPDLIIVDERDLVRERAQLIALIDRFAAIDPRADMPRHSFFGTLTVEEWSILMYKHLDHHLRQFSA